ncbi:MULTISPECIES: indolepyruvate oxidoreductase subunit beta [Ruminococcus]|uniref:indolepyruvate oxidoreductase subunit beta n=1 Tax=Ruminococcus TaxID=1263 RepID=UPI00033E59BF|nr:MULTISPECIES: indolepyruvate oxidoreductase subunit beta [Ruminococcus]CDD53992.1 pyruvate:ferredoxin oxidoreductase and related 2-oxoacid:ferredoxin oxidoreductases gamma subunit [Ruminococcus sp. CAG:379]
MTSTSCLLCGVGGQGTVLASKLLAYAYMQQGKSVRTAETIGMAQRGGCVVSHVRAGAEIHSPLIPKGKADVMIAFEPAEAVRCLPFLKQGGTVVVNQKAVKPVTASLSGLAYTGAEMLEYLQSAGIRTILIDGDAVCAACQSPKVLNIALLAAAANTDALGISVAQLKDAVQQLVPEKFHALNLGAIEYVCNR